MSKEQLAEYLRYLASEVERGNYFEGEIAIHPGDTTLYSVISVWRDGNGFICTRNTDEAETQQIV